MATIGPSVTITAIGPGGTREIGFSNFFVTGQTPWGLDGTFQICTSFQDFLRKYGGLNKLSAVASGTTADTYSAETNSSVVQPYYAVQAFFQEKQANAPGVLYFCRTVATSSGPTAASKTFADAVGSNNTTVASKMKGLPGSTTQITVVNPSPTAAQWVGGQPGTAATTASSATVTGTGTSFSAGMVGQGIQIAGVAYVILTFSSSTSITVSPTPSATVATTTYNLAAPSCQIKASFPQANIVESWDILNVNDAANASKKSELISITLPAGGQLPVNAAAAKLASGTPATADSYAATDADLVGTTTAAGVKTGLQVFNDQKLGSGFVAIPGKYSSTVRTGINTHCSTFYRLGILGAPSGLNLSSVVTDPTLSGPDLDYIWPQIYVADQSSTSGGQILVDGVGHRAGLYARMDKEYRGPHKSAAGITHPLVSAIDVERASGSFMELCDDAGSNLLADSLINTWRLKGNPASVVGWGNRTLGQDNRFRQCSVRRILYLLYLTSYLSIETYTFEPIDPFGVLFSKVKGDLDSICWNLWRPPVGALYGNQPGKDPKSTDAWFVVCDSSNNPVQAIANGELHVDVSFTPTYNAERVTENLSLVVPQFVGRAQ